MGGPFVRQCEGICTIIHVKSKRITTDLSTQDKILENINICQACEFAPIANFGKFATRKMDKKCLH